MMKKTFLILFLVTAAGAPAIGCKEAPTEAQPTSTANATADLSAEVSARVDTALGDYEALRAALAGDRLGEVAAIATRLEGSASAAKAGAPSSVASRRLIALRTKHARPRAIRLPVPDGPGLSEVGANRREAGESVHGRQDASLWIFQRVEPIVMLDALLSGLTNSPNVQRALRAGSYS
jgi:hypothetical protein